ncbi:unnamed protein product [Prunus armeniaca]|uniref:Uncharacterized protein n=1 Tax=Prunus armeniaca TaxID=36596 RepID=A0A6J5USL3_PRUAR|nr:unnamed protein product [Prunus armeniaca]CAB4309949.1 unnamed protein product [Prunus armeniaca]
MAVGSFRWRKSKSKIKKIINPHKMRRKKDEEGKRANKNGTFAVNNETTYATIEVRSGATKGLEWS